MTDWEEKIEDTSGGAGANVEENREYDRRLLTKMTRQQKISNALLYLVLVATVATYHLTLANFGLEEKGVQVPHYFLKRRFILRSRIVGIRG